MVEVARMAICVPGRHAGSVAGWGDRADAGRRRGFSTGGVPEQVEGPRDFRGVGGPRLRGWARSVRRESVA
jgi:hypothetical protein